MVSRSVGGHVLGEKTSSAMPASRPATPASAVARVAAIAKHLGIGRSTLSGAGGRRRELEQASNQDGHP
jgi:hypothetical protein